MKNIGIRKWQRTFLQGARLLSRSVGIPLTENPFHHAPQNGNMNFQYICKRGATETGIYSFSYIYFVRLAEFKYYELTYHSEDKTFEFTNVHKEKVFDVPSGLQGMRINPKDIKAILLV